MKIPYDASRAGGEHPSGGDQHGRPEQDDDHHGRVEAAVRQAGREHVRQGARDVGEQCRVVEGRLGELTPDRDEAHPGRDPLRHPVVDAARPARGELGRHERRRQQEHDRGQDVDRHRRETEHGRRGRGAEIAHRPQGQHRHRQPGERRLRPGRRTSATLGRVRIRRLGCRCHLFRRLSAARQLPARHSRPVLRRNVSAPSANAARPAAAIATTSSNSASPSGAGSIARASAS